MGPGGGGDVSVCGGAWRQGGTYSCSRCPCVVDPPAEGLGNLRPSEDPQRTGSVRPPSTNCTDTYVLPSPTSAAPPPACLYPSARPTNRVEPTGRAIPPRSRDTTPSQQRMVVPRGRVTPSLLTLPPSPFPHSSAFSLFRHPPIRPPNFQRTFVSARLSFRDRALLSPYLSFPKPNSYPWIVMHTQT